MKLSNTKTWRYNQNFSSLHLNNENHIGETAEASLFHGTFIENNHWEEVKIDYSDLEAMRIIHSIV